MNFMNPDKTELVNCKVYLKLLAASFEVDALYKD